MDENYYVLKVKVRENLTDARAVERMKAWNFTMKEWQSFEKEICPFYSPDLYSSCEPIREIFNMEDIRKPSYHLAFPAGTLLLKKRRRFDVAMMNLNYGLIFDPYNKYMVIPSKKKIGEYLGDIRVIIKKNTNKFTLEQLQTIVDDMCEYLGTDYGVLTHWDNYARKDIEILYQYKKVDG